MVSSDFVTDTHSSVVDAGAGLSLTPTFHKLVSWYGGCPLLHVHEGSEPL